MEDWLTKALDKATEKGIEKSIEKGMQTGLEKFVKCVDSLMKNGGYSKERACKLLDSIVDEYEKAKKLLTETTIAV